MRALDPGFCTESFVQSQEGSPRRTNLYKVFGMSSFIASFAFLLPLSGFPWHYAQLPQLYRQSQENRFGRLRPLGIPQAFLEVFASGGVLKALGFSVPLLDAVFGVPTFLTLETHLVSALVAAPGGIA